MFLKLIPFLFTKRKAAFACVFLCSIATTNSIAQDTASSDDLFVAARKAAFDNNDYNTAKIYCIKALELSPSYADIRIFLGRLYTWSKVYDSAKISFEKAITDAPSYADAYIAYADLEYWNDHYKNALSVINEGLKNNASNVDLLIRKAKVENAIHDYKNANKSLNKIFTIDKKNAEALKLANTIKDNAALNKAAVSYDYVYFDKQFSDPWQLVSFDYTRSTKLGSITGRVNYANRFKENGVQYELEAYPHISKTFYSYLNFGFSDNNSVFPHWRAGFSLYSNLPASFEAEVGWRYLYFSNPTNILTAYIGKYYKNYLLSARTYLTPGKTGFSNSYSISARYYYGNADNYFGATAGAGISPDDRAFAQQLESDEGLKSYKASLEFRHSFKTLNIITLNASWINQEYLPKTSGNQYQAGIGYMRRF